METYILLNMNNNVQFNMAMEQVPQVMLINQPAINFPSMLYTINTNTDMPSRVSVIEVNPNHSKSEVKDNSVNDMKTDLDIDWPDSKLIIDEDVETNADFKNHEINVLNNEKGKFSSNLKPESENHFDYGSIEIKKEKVEIFDDDCIMKNDDLLDIPISIKNEDDVRIEENERDPLYIPDIIKNEKEVNIMENDSDPLYIQSNFKKKKRGKIVKNEHDMPINIKSEKGVKITIKIMKNEHDLLDVPVSIKNEKDVKIAENEHNLSNISLSKKYEKKIKIAKSECDPLYIPTNIKGDKDVKMSNSSQIKKMGSNFQIGMLLEELQQSQQCNNYVCNICKKTFRFNVALLDHLENHHNVDNTDMTEQDTIDNNCFVHKNMKCYHASEAKKTDVMLSKELTSKIVSKLVRKHNLMICDLEPVFNIISVHGRNRKTISATCRKCEKIFNRAPLKILQQHLRDCYLLYKFICHYCQMKFEWETRYKSHLSRRHNVRVIFMCKLCSRVFKSQVLLDMHVTKCQKKED